MTNQIVSKQRVADHGEVLTNEREVNAMLDLVKHETERIESRFLEPACGTGNFLAEVLERKLAVVNARYRRDQNAYEKHAVIAIGSVYGVDILKDNVEACRGRLYAIFDRHYSGRFGNASRSECRRVARFILARNITWGDALTLRTVDGEARPIVFSEWSLARGGMVKRRDFTFKELLDHQALVELPLFSDQGERAFIPTPLREFPLTPFLEIVNADVD